jgi:hypothetical protein
MAAIASAQVDIKLNFMPVIDGLNLVEIVAKIRYEEWARGAREYGGETEPIPTQDWDEVEDRQRLSWKASTRDLLEAAVNS